MLFDSHCHLDLPPLGEDPAAVLARAWDAGVGQILIPGVTRDRWERVQLLCQLSHPVQRCFALGLHPCFLDVHQDQADLDHLESELATRADVRAVGECGLDLYIEDPQFDRQLALFDAQLRLAKRYDRPVIIHARRALDQVIKLLRQHKLPAGGVVHAFSGSAQQAQQLWDLGFYIGIGGALTYERAQKLRRVAASHPLEAILLETDAPDMPLSGFQGQPNEPAQVARVAQQLAQLRDESIDQVIATTTGNAQSLFLRSA